MLAKCHKSFILFETTLATTEPPAHPTFTVQILYIVATADAMNLLIEVRVVLSKRRDLDIQAAKAFYGTDLDC